MIETENKKNLLESKIVLSNKKNLCINGVTKFISSTNSCVVLNINNEEFVVEGKGLTVTNLDLNRYILELQGDVCALSFQGAENSKFSFKNFFKR